MILYILLIGYSIVQLLGALVIMSKGTYTDTVTWKGATVALIAHIAFITIMISLIREG